MPAPTAVDASASSAVLAHVLAVDARWVALVGPPGVGKSHLARVVVAALPPGAFASVRVLELSGVASEAALLDALGPDDDDATLLVLDGVDALSPSALGAAERRGGRVLSTSRARPIAPHPGLAVVEVAPLAVPPDDALVGPAAELFLSFTRAHGRGEPRTEAEAATLAALVRELDGLPLALALAAPRLSVMSPSALLHRVRQSRAVLRGDAGSFDAAMEGAWQALEDHAQDALAQLTMFARGATVDAAEAVLVLPPGAPPVVDVLEGLRARALLGAASGADGALRLVLLRSVRDFVLRKAPLATRVAARRRHAAHFAHEAEAVASDPARLTEERAELVAVVEGVLAEAPMTARLAEPALRVILALHPGADAPPPRAWAPLVEAGIEATRDSGADPTLVARALSARGALRRALGDDAGAVRDLARARELGRRAASPVVEGLATLELARVLYAASALDEAADHARQAAAVLSSARAPEEVTAILVLAEIARDQGAVDEARALLDGARVLGAGTDRVRRALVELDLDLGAFDAARARLGERDEHPAWDVLEAGLAHGLGDPAAAHRAVDRAIESARRANLPGVEAAALAERALLRLREGALGEVPVLLRIASDVQGPTPHRHGPLLEALGVHVARRATPSAPSAPLSTRAQRDPYAARLAASGSIDPTAFEPRLAWDRRLRAIVAALADKRARAAAPADAWVVGDEGRVCRAPTGELVDLERRRPLARIVHHLAVARQERPGRALSNDELLAAGWPGERVLAAAGAHRVRVALSTLRKLGLRELLQTTDDGYCFDPRVAVVFEA